jgi:hypothetical protein
VCIECSEETRNPKYCSVKCQQTYQRGKKITRWLSGDFDATMGRGEVSSTIRDYLIDQAGHCCTKCQWSEVHPVTGRVPLQVDHINGDPTDSSPANLRVLCPNCHSLTPSFGALNKGNGRSNRYNKEIK